MKNIVALILGGGAGTRLQPLTTERAKPAVPIAGKYRLVDIPISNCIHSHIRKIYLLTQFNSVSLHQHIQSTYKFDDFNGSYVRILAAQQTPNSEAWYDGTADAVRQTFRHFMDDEPEFIVILSGDQLYHMNFEEVIAEHRANNADVTICTKPVPRDQAGSLGIMHINDQKKIVTFKEKPGDSADLDALKAPIYEEERYLASMGIYVFNTKVLQALLTDNQENDFGKHVIPEAIDKYNVFSYVFDGYWRDIGTIGSFLEANLALTDPVPEYDIYDAKSPIYTRMRYLPPSKINRCDLYQSMVTEGCIIDADLIRRSIIGQRAVVGEGTVIENSYVMGADFYQQEVNEIHTVPLGIGQRCSIKHAIIDKNVRIGNDVVISPEGKADEEITEFFHVRSGVIVIPKNTVIPDGTKL